ncbi:MAG: hypothetical protein IJU90_05700 [Bacteroidales bacterium]|nr:hypothetical protein [Bacteroidales bacterium]
MKTVNYTKEGVNVNTELDGVIVRKHISGLAGGRALGLDALKDNSNNVLVAAYTNNVVPCGLPIITDGNGNYIPLPPTDVTSGEGQSATTTYQFNKPDGWTYAGLCGATILAGKPASVIVAGAINEVALLANITEHFPSSLETPNALSLSAIKSALPHLIFEKDEAGDVPSV